MISRYEQFSSAVSGIYRSIQKIEREEMEKYGCRGSFAQYLAVMNRHPEGMTSAQLCEACDRDKAAVSRAVAEMTEKGLITRGQGMYRVRLRLTEEGSKAAAFVCERAERAVEAVGNALTDEDRRIFYASLDLISERLEEIGRAGIPEE